LDLKSQNSATGSSCCSRFPELFSNKGRSSEGKEIRCGLVILKDQLLRIQECALLQSIVRAVNTVLNVSGFTSKHSQAEVILAALSQYRHQPQPFSALLLDV